MALFSLQRRLAASIVKCGKRKIWIDPNEKNEISLTDSRANIRKLLKDGFILKKNSKNHSKNSIRLRNESGNKGRHRGFGKREGTKNARYSYKRIWITRQRVLRNYLKKSRINSKIDNHLYRELYLKCKGNEFKNKRILIDYIQRSKIENKRKSILYEKFEKKRNKKILNKEKKIQLFNKKMFEISTSSSNLNN